jgi:folate-binding Fe-S cluster repair protein YgfZ
MYDFLQGLITNDIRQLSTEGQSSIYTLFLNAKGRVLYDAIIYNGRTNEELFIECDSRGLDSLEKHIKMFRIRKKVDITNHEDFGTWVLYNPKGQTLDPEEQVLDKDLIAMRDPRLPELGLRILGPKDSDLKDKLKESFTLGDGGFKLYRYPH